MTDTTLIERLDSLDELTPPGIWVAFTESQLAGTIATPCGQPIAACYDISFTGQQHPRPDTARFIAALVNAYRDGSLVPADALEAQQKRIDALTEALQPFSNACDIFSKEYGPDMKPETSCGIRFAALSKARQALQPEHKEGE